MRGELKMDYEETTDVGRVFEALRAGAKVTASSMMPLGVVIAIDNTLKWMDGRQVSVMENRIYRIYAKEEPKYVRHEVKATADGRRLVANGVRIDIWIARADFIGFEFEEWPGLICPSPIEFVGTDGVRMGCGTENQLKNGERKSATLAALWQRVQA